MTGAPHLRRIPGPAAEFAATLRAQLPTIRTARCQLRSPVLEDAVAWIAIMVPDAQGHLAAPIPRPKPLSNSLPMSARGCCAGTGCGR
jgi:hypothetical protein